MNKAFLSASLLLASLALACPVMASPDLLQQQQANDRMEARAHLLMQDLDDIIRRQMIEASIARARAFGHPCPCPYSVTRNGSACGPRSLYSTSARPAPLCYPADITPNMLADWKAKHQ